MPCATGVLGSSAMSGAALALVLGAAVIHATWNALAKRGRDPMAILWWAGAIGSLIMTPFAIYILWHGGASPRAVPFVVATVILHSVYFFTLARAYQSGDFSLLYPLARGLGVASVPAAASLLFAFQLSKAGYVVAGREVSIVISALMGSLWLKEGALGKRLLGAGVVASGVICVALAR